MRTAQERRHRTGFAPCRSDGRRGDMDFVPERLAVRHPGGPPGSTRDPRTLAGPLQAHRLSAARHYLTFWRPAWSPLGSGLFASGLLDRASGGLEPYPPGLSLGRRALVSSHNDPHPAIFSSMPAAVAQSTGRMRTARPSRRCGDLHSLPGRLAGTGRRCCCSLGWAGHPTGPCAPACPECDSWCGLFYACASSLTPPRRARWRRPT